MKSLYDFYSNLSSYSDQDLSTIIKHKIPNPADESICD